MMVDNVTPFDQSNTNTSVIDYDVLYHSNVSRLVLHVKRQIEIGWVPIGGMECSDHNFYQTMIKVQKN